jgi:hypothetical protein
MTKVYYLATPYSSPNPMVVRERYEQALKIGHALIKAGLILIQPIAMLHVLAQKYKLPGDFAFWQLHNKAMIDHCDGLIVAKMPGWEFSKGVQYEILYAKEKEMKIYYVDMEGNFI